MLKNMIPTTEVSDKAAEKNTNRKVHVSPSAIRLLLAATEKAVAIETAIDFNHVDHLAEDVLQALHDYKVFRLENALQFVDEVCKCRILEGVLNEIDTRAIRAFHVFLGAPERAPVIGRDCSFDQFASRITAKPVKRLNKEVAR